MAVVLLYVRALCGCVVVLSEGEWRSVSRCCGRRGAGALRQRCGGCLHPGDQVRPMHSGEAEGRQQRLHRWPSVVMTASLTRSNGLCVDRSLLCCAAAAACCGGGGGCPACVCV